MEEVELAVCEVVVVAIGEVTMTGSVGFVGRQAMVISATNKMILKAIAIDIKNGKTKGSDAEKIFLALPPPISTGGERPLTSRTHEFFCARRTLSNVQRRSFERQKSIQSKTLGDNRNESRVFISNSFRGVIVTKGRVLLRRPEANI